MCIRDSNFDNASFRAADLDNARLSGGSFNRTDFRDASLRRTDIRGLDLSRARGLTADQVEEACGDASTRLPGGLTARNCRGGVRVIRTPPAPPTPPVPPIPPRQRNLVITSGN